MALCRMRRKVEQASCLSALQWHFPRSFADVPQPVSTETGGKLVPPSQNPCQATITEPRSGFHRKVGRSSARCPLTLPPSGGMTEFRQQPRARLTFLSTTPGCRPRLDARAKGCSEPPRATPENNGRPAIGERRQPRARPPHPEETRSTRPISTGPNPDSTRVALLSAAPRECRRR